MALLKFENDILSTNNVFPKDPDAFGIDDFNLYETIKHAISKLNDKEQEELFMELYLYDDGDTKLQTVYMRCYDTFHEYMSDMDVFEQLDYIQYNKPIYSWWEIMSSDSYYIGIPIFMLLYLLRKSGHTITDRYVYVDRIFNEKVRKRHCNNDGEYNFIVLVTQTGDMLSSCYIHDNIGQFLQSKRSNKIIKRLMDDNKLSVEHLIHSAMCDMIMSVETYLNYLDIYKKDASVRELFNTNSDDSDDEYGAGDYYSDDSSIWGGKKS